MTILLVGGTGKTGLPLARLLRDANHSLLIASRSPDKVPEPFKGVAFDWFEPSTYENPFNVDSNITRVYIVGPPVLHMLPTVKEFVELAITKGVKRFVFLSASSTPRGSLSMGQVHEYLAERGVEYAILRPSWFFGEQCQTFTHCGKLPKHTSENFTYIFYQSIRESNDIATTVGDGKVPFVSADDIAEVAFRALVDEQSHNTDHIIVGPELYTYDEVAVLLSEVLGRTIKHKRLTQDEGKALWESFGLDEEYALTMLDMERWILTGKEEALFHAEAKDVGERRINEYFQANREAWIVE
ncbi:hypothetical protein DXG03_002413 [Asterophora parasitica]|uniref:NmrA-like domain-containing protein n=1 Tax=Asterophora parasitica TaxID=117018 RepID=A0A9P7GBD0_9AGAR|nr:hypothetical protein DXG03_002413 [Asterophora parasitica]